jgi:hypothetical protein
MISYKNILTIKNINCLMGKSYDKKPLHIYYTSYSTPKKQKSKMSEIEPLVSFNMM